MENRDYLTNLYLLKLIAYHKYECTITLYANDYIDGIFTGTLTFRDGWTFWIDTNKGRRYIEILQVKDMGCPEFDNNKLYELILGVE